MMESKKAKAYLLAEISWKVVLLACLVVVAFQVYNEQTPNLAFVGFMGVVVLVAGFIEVAYIGKQGDLDRYVRVAQIAVGAGMGVDKDGSMFHRAPETKPEVPPAEPPLVDEPVMERPTDEPPQG